MVTTLMIGQFNNFFSVGLPTRSRQSINEMSPTCHARQKEELDQIDFLTSQNIFCSAHISHWNSTQSEAARTS